MTSQVTKQYWPISNTYLIDGSDLEHHHHHHRRRGHGADSATLGCEVPRAIYHYDLRTKRLLAALPPHLAYESSLYCTDTFIENILDYSNLPLPAVDHVGR